jgi:hypothetical protein
MTDVIEIDQIEMDWNPEYEQFDFIENPYYRDMLRNAYWATTECGLWDWLREFNETSFMFSDSPNINVLFEKMQQQEIGRCHSGCSFAITMRAMERIAKNGMKAFVAKNQFR